MPVSFSPKKASARATYSLIIGPAAHDGAQDRFQSFNPPFIGDDGREHVVEFGNPSGDTADQFGKELAVSRWQFGILAFLGTAGDTMDAEFGNDHVRLGAGLLPLIERLHGGQARRPALQRQLLTAFLAADGFFVGHL